MDGYVEREKIRESYEKLTRSHVNGDAYIADWRFDEMIESIPAADVAPVKHGRRNHSDKHLWFKDSDGEIDIFMYRDGCHHGPVCRVCGVSFCVNCTPDFDETTCYLGHYECSECGYQMEEDTSRFCPNCGAKMDGKQNA